MHIEPIHLLAAVAVGIGATLVMDLWALFLRRAFNITSLDYCLVGRWLAHMPAGVFRHASIGAAARRPGECTLGWIAHYATGVVFALIVVLLASPRWLQNPTLLPAMAVGLATITIPFFVMQPSLGLGIAAAKTPDPARARLRSVMTHAVFGFGLYVSALVLGAAFGLRA